MLVDAKAKGQEIVSEEAPPQATNVIHLMEALQRSVEQTRESRKWPSADQGKKKGRGEAARGGKDQWEQLSKGELYEQATKLDIPGRSKMNRNQLINALQGRPLRSLGVDVAVQRRDQRLADRLPDSRTLTEPLLAGVGIGRGAPVVTWVDIGVPAARLDTPIHSQLAMIQSERESPTVIPILEIENQIGRQARVFCDRMPFPAG